MTLQRRVRFVQHLLCWKWARTAALALAATVVSTGAMAQTDDDSLSTLTAEAEALSNRGEYDDAEFIYTHIYSVRQGMFGETDRRTWAALYDLAHFYFENHRPQQAVPLYSEVIDQMTRLGRSDDPIVAQARADLDALEEQVEQGAIDSIIVRSTGPSARLYTPGARLSDADVITLQRGDLVTISRAGHRRTFRGPGRFQVGVRERSDSILGGLLGSNAIFAGVRTGVARGRSSVPTYPVWPPETASSRVSLSRYIGSRTGMSLGDAGDRLRAAFERAGYLEYSYYAVPGGFALVTRIEQMDESGNRLRGTERYELPGDRTEDSLSSILYSLFVNAPPGYYRYIVVVVSARPFSTRNRRLSDTEALRRLRGGANALSSAYDRIPFSSDYNVDALIYEFRWDGSDRGVRMIDPGRIPPATHLQRTGLASAVRASFR